MVRTSKKSNYEYNVTRFLPLILIVGVLGRMCSVVHPRVFIIFSLRTIEDPRFDRSTAKAYGSMKLCYLGAFWCVCSAMALRDAALQVLSRIQKLAQED